MNNNFVVNQLSLINRVENVIQKFGYDTEYWTESEYLSFLTDEGFTVEEVHKYLQHFEI